MTLIREIELDHHAIRIEHEQLPQIDRCEVVLGRLDLETLEPRADALEIAAVEREVVHRSPPCCATNGTASSLGYAASGVPM
jgi:hypothetical protein